MKVRLPDAMVALGRILDLVLEDDDVVRVVDWPKREHWLCTDRSRQVLYVLPAPKGGAHGRFPERVTTQLAELASVFRTWSDFEPKRASMARPRLARDWKPRGRVVRVLYRSRKWTNKSTDYVHDFKNRPRIAQLGQLYRISGGSLKVRAAGITG